MPEVAVDDIVQLMSLRDQLDTAGIPCCNIMAVAEQRTDSTAAVLASETLDTLTALYDHICDFILTLPHEDVAEARKQHYG